ncbi:hypothetical protein VTI74DRAFT_10823 [Chaetomium olivicolor]
MYQPLEARKAVFGTHRTRERLMRTLWQLMLIVLNDRVPILQCVVAAVSVALGLYQSVALPHAPGQPCVEWVDGVTIVTAVIIVVVAGALNEYHKEQRFARLNKKARLQSYFKPPSPLLPPTQTKKKERKKERKKEKKRKKEKGKGIPSFGRVRQNKGEKQMLSLLAPPLCSLGHRRTVCLTVDAERGPDSQRSAIRQDDKYLHI